MFTNNFVLCRFMLRRDRLSLLLWMIVILFLTVGYGSALPGMYPSEAERMVMAETFKNPAMLSMMGPVYAEGGYSIGAMYSNFILLWSALIFAIMNIFLVIRHTRKDEERGRIEVIRSLPVGRLSNLSAVLSASVFVNFVFSLIIGLGLSALNIESMDFQGSMLFGLSLGAIGLLFAVITAIFCQLCSNPKTAQGLSFAFLTFCFILRAAGDMRSEVLARISPLGLILRTKIYVENIWWPVLVIIMLGFALSVLAFYLCSIRDMGEGLIPARPGKKNASPLLSSAGGLAWRLLRTSFIIWSVVVFLAGISYGSIMGDLESFVSTNEMFKAIFSNSSISLTEQFVTFLMVIMAIMNTIPVLSFMVKARTQEKGGYSENIVARSVSRSNQLFSYLLTAVIASIVMPVLTAVGFWLASSAVMDNPISLSTYLQAIIVYIPAIWMMLGLAVALIAYLPHFTSLAWLMLGYSFFVVYIGSAFNLPEWAKKLSPYGYIPKLPVEDMNFLAVSVLVTLSAVLAVVGFIGYRNRDMKFS